MKRLVFCFDGSWNRLDAPFSTNVVITAESVLPTALSDGTIQAIFYDEGVGTRKGEKLSGGIFGHGIVENLGDAYRSPSSNELFRRYEPSNVLKSTHSIPGRPIIIIVRRNEPTLR